MFETTAFFLGALTTSSLFIYNSIFWITMSLSNIRIEKVGFGFPKVYTLVINKIALEWGVICLGGFVRPSGMIDESLDETGSRAPFPYEFRARSQAIQSALLLSAPLTFLAAGIVFMITTGCLNIEDISMYLSIAFFLEPMEYGNALWEKLCTDRVALFGFFLLLLGIMNLMVTNLWSMIIPEKFRFFLFIPYSATLVGYSAIFRLFWQNLSINNLLYFLVGTFIIYVIIIPINIILAKILPNNL